MSMKILLFQENFKFESCGKIKLQSPKQSMDTYWTPDYSTIVVVVKMCTNPHEYSI
jgi:hypothetical protein